MVVSAVQSSERKSHSSGYFAAAAIGGLGGYALRWTVPVFDKEQDEFPNSFNNSFRKNYKNTAKQEEIHKIKNKHSRTKGEDVFVKMYDKKELTAEKIKKLQPPNNEHVQKIVYDINAKARKAKSMAENASNLIIKSIRPAVPFIIAGACTAVGINFVINSIKKMSDKD